MKFCPHCGKELSAQTNFCSECGKGLGGNIFNLPPKFYMTLAGVVSVLIFSLANWISIPLIGGFNLFSMWSALDDIRWLLGSSEDFETLRVVIIIFSVLLALSFVFLIVSLINYQTKSRSKLAYCGFGLSSFVSLMFIVSIMIGNEGMDGSGMTIFPFFVFVTAIASMVFSVERSTSNSPDLIVLPVKTIVAIGIGTALFFLLARFVSIPVFANTTVNFQYALLSFFATLFGPIAGLLIGLIGHIITDMTFPWGLWWSWIIVSGLVGFGFGFLMKNINVEEGEFETMPAIIRFVVGTVIINLIGWGGVAPVLDILIYAEPVNRVFIQGLIAFAGNATTTAIVGTILILAYSKAKPKKGSLSKD